MLPDATVVRSSVLEAALRRSRPKFLKFRTFTRAFLCVCGGEILEVAIVKGGGGESGGEGGGKGGSESGSEVAIVKGGGGESGCAGRW